MRQGVLRPGIAAGLVLLGSYGIGAAAGPETGPQAFVQLAQAADQATLMREGGPLYTGNCAVCHGQQGQGDMGPKLIGYEFLKSAPAVVSQIFNGMEEHGMPPFRDVLNDRKIAAIATYIRNAWGNTYGIVTPADVAGLR
jgi:mono/diheme cytochrome c family protein